MATVLPIAPTIPIACTLDAGDFAGRMAWIATLNRTGLRAYQQDGLTLTLDYTPEAAAQVRELVAREQECCAFLTFRVEETPDGVRLSVEALPAVHDAVDAVFAPFLTGACPADHGADGSRAPGLATGTAGVAALARGVRCVLPFALPAVALASVGGVLAAFARVYWWALAAAVLAVAAAWGWVGWQILRARHRPARSKLRAMTVATLLLGVAVSWSYLEPLIRRTLRA